jgi:hypothetical protein
VVPSSTYYRVWQEARLLALPPAVAASPLASRPYDPRHSALSTWLNAGVDPTEVAERAGNRPPTTEGPAHSGTSLMPTGRRPRPER